MKCWSARNFLLAAAIMIFVIAGTAAQGAGQGRAIRYVAIGDSYTEGTGGRPQDAWPVVLTDHLRSQGVDIKLVANLARSGWTSEQVIVSQVPALVPLKPDIVTVLVGANDWVRGVGPDEFAKRVKVLLDYLQEIVPGDQKILVLTIPDFSVTPYAQNFGGDRLQVRNGLAQFNAIITKEAKSRGLNVVDLFRISQDMGKDPSLVAPDGLHPSAKEHQVWEKLIYPVFAQMLK